MIGACKIENERISKQDFKNGTTKSYSKIKKIKLKISTQDSKKFQLANYKNLLEILTNRFLC
jgi:hypothetical protein